MIQSILSNPFCLTHWFHFGGVIHRNVHVRILELFEFVHVGEVSAITCAVLSVIYAPTNLPPLWPYCSRLAAILCQILTLWRNKKRTPPILSLTLMSFSPQNFPSAKLLCSVSKVKPQPLLRVQRSCLSDIGKTSSEEGNGSFERKFVWIKCSAFFLLIKAPQRNDLRCILSFRFKKQQWKV